MMLGQRVPMMKRQGMKGQSAMPRRPMMPSGMPVQRETMEAPAASMPVQAAMPMGSMMDRMKSYMRGCS